MRKLLTLSIAAYNAERYIKNALDSLIVESILDVLEVFIIDDGGKDSTLDIAREYEKKYPSTFHAIHKENGGFGSTVNYSIAAASGKYFKLLDADDWYETEGLISLVRFLDEIDDDLIVIPYYRVLNDERTLCCAQEKNQKRCSVSSLEKQRDWIGNPSVCFKTEVLKNSGISLPEHTAYTDAIYCIEAMEFVESVAYFSKPVYCYRIGNDEQTVSKKNMLKNLDKLKDIAIRLVEFSNKNRGKANYSYICKYVARNSNVVVRTILCKENENGELKEFDLKVKSINMDVYNKMSVNGKIGHLLKIIRFTNYRISKLINKIMKRI